MSYIFLLCVHVILDVDNDDISLLEETLTPSEDMQTPETASVTESKEKVGRPKKVIAKVIAKKPMTRARKSNEGKKAPPAKISPPKYVPKYLIYSQCVYCVIVADYYSSLFYVHAHHYVLSSNVPVQGFLNTIRYLTLFSCSLNY